jgi:hypothetical protein
MVGFMNFLKFFNWFHILAGFSQFFNFIFLHHFGSLYFYSSVILLLLSLKKKKFSDKIVTFLIQHGTPKSSLIGHFSFLTVFVLFISLSTQQTVVISDQWSVIIHTHPSAEYIARVWAVGKKKLPYINC